jgi:hypothetical protein
MNLDLQNKQIGDTVFHLLYGERKILEIALTERNPKQTYTVLLDNDCRYLVKPDGKYAADDLHPMMFDSEKDARDYFFNFGLVAQAVIESEPERLWAVATIWNDDGEQHLRLNNVRASNEFEVVGKAWFANVAELPKAAMLADVSYFPQ